MHDLKIKVSKAEEKATRAEVWAMKRRAVIEFCTLVELQEEVIEFAIDLYLELSDELPSSSSAPLS